MLELLEASGFSWAVYDWSRAFAVADPQGAVVEPLRRILRPPVAEER
jgi:hypothetical protein